MNIGLGRYEDTVQEVGEAGNSGWEKVLVMKYSSHMEIFSVVSFGGKNYRYCIWHALKRGPRVEILFHVDRLAHPMLRYLWKMWAEPCGKPLTGVMVSGPMAQVSEGQSGVPGTSEH